MAELPENPAGEEVINFLKSIDRRIKVIEDRLGIYEEESSEGGAALSVEEKEENLELRIGQFWFAKAGIVILAIGIAFLLTFPYKNLHSAIPSLFGYCVAACIIWLSYFWKKIFAHLSGYLLGGGIALLFFTTLRLRFFGFEPAVPDMLPVVILLLLAASAGVYLSLKRESIYLTSLSLFLFYSTAVVSDYALFVFILNSVMAGLIVYLSLKYGWANLVLYGVVMNYLVHFTWFVNNPFMGNEFQVTTTPGINLFFLMLYAVIFSADNLLKGSSARENFVVNLTTFLNIGGSYGLFFLITFSEITPYFGFYHVLASAVYLSLSIIFWVRQKSKYSTFFFAMIGYLSLSVAIIYQFPKPDFFIWLCWQSLLVVSTAVWFRSKIIIVANFVIYLIVLLAYLALEGKVDLVSSSYGIVALLSARILNWKKDKLELRTEYMRNAYLLTALLIIPYALYNAMPPTLVSVSWVMLAVIYYVLSVMLKNTKYRWMALLTLLLTVGYVFIIGITSADPTYKIVSFIVLGVVLIVFSIVYSRRKAKRDGGTESEYPK